MNVINYLTKEGYENLVQEIHQLKTKERQIISAAIQEAREKGDLSENAEYDAAKEAQGLLELKISKLETVLANARILDDEDIDISKVYILCNCKLKNMKDNKEVTYTLVSQKEANLKENKISVDSPIGKGILGKKVGDVVDIIVPAGTMQFEILEISR